MSNEKKIGDIDVSMGDGNTVGHIGHKITFQAPPPDPNAIWQNGIPVGILGGPPVAGVGTYTFEKLFIDGPFDQAQPFSVQGVKLKVESIDALTSSSIGGRPPQKTLWNAVCRIIG